MAEADDTRLKAGPELDAMVAERVMGWQRRLHPQVGNYWLDESGYAKNWPPEYSTDIRAAWAVVNRLRDKKWLVVIKVMPEGFPFYYDQDDPERRHFYHRSVVSADYQPMATTEECRRYIHGHVIAIADEEPLAICRCALRVIEEEERYPV